MVVSENAINADEDCRSLTGLGHSAWLSYKDYVGLYHPEIHTVFKHLDTPWDDILALFQLKIRCGISYTFLEQLFKKDKSTLGRYVRTMFVFLFRVSSIAMQYDTREEDEKRRISTFQDNVGDIDFRSVHHVIGNRERERERVCVCVCACVCVCVFAVVVLVLLSYVLFLFP